MSEPVVELQSISKAYSGITAVDKVTMNFFAGEVVGLVGKNGAGKSTVIRIIAGAERPDHGIISVLGRVMPCLDTRAATLHGLAFVHQELNDVPMLSVADNVLLGSGYPRIAGTLLDRAEMRRKAQAALARIHADIDPDRKVGTLSVAERRMVMIARALIGNAKMIVMDEPSASLTDREIEELHRVIRTLRGDGVCVVYVSHRLGEILELTDRIIVMRDGTVVGETKTSEMSQQSLIKLIVGNADYSCYRPETRLRKSRNAQRPCLQVTNLDPFGAGSCFSLEVMQGEIVGLAGLTGSGRTETLRQIVGADYQPSVVHRRNGRTVSITNPRRAFKHGIALVPEDRRHQGALLDFSIQQNVTLSSLRGSRWLKALPFPSRRAERGRAEPLSARLGIRAASTDQTVSELSGGNQQKVVLARCLAANVEILLLDEPTHGIDVYAKDEIYALVRELAHRGTAIILVSSDLQELVDLADRAVVLRAGRKIAELEGDELTERNILTTCFAPMGQHLAG